jgi:hypothetical protein
MQGIPLDSVKPPQYVPDWNLLHKASTEDPYISADLEVLKESVIYLVIVANSFDSSQKDFKGWTRNEAIVPGLLLRSSRLISGFLSEVVADRMDTAFVLVSCKRQHT